jgi:NADPH:quinone reductase-like Zn-dependent oxidoreductase
MPFEEAAALPLASLTAWQALVDTAHIQPGETVLIHGASGGVGHLAVQIAKARGASVVATGRSANHDFLRALGADECVDRESVPVGEAASDVDVVLDFVGRHESLAEVDALRDGGTLVAIANGASDEAKEAAAVRDIRVAEILVEPDGRALEEIAALAADGRLKVTVEQVLPLEEAAAAHELLEAGGVRGKLVLNIK